MKRGLFALPLLLALTFVWECEAQSPANFTRTGNQILFKCKREKKAPATATASYGLTVLDSTSLMDCAGKCFDDASTPMPCASFDFKTDTATSSTAPFSAPLSATITLYFRLRSLQHYLPR